jgi:hypothetical protein
VQRGACPSENRSQAIEFQRITNHSHLLDAWIPPAKLAGLACPAKAPSPRPCGKTMKVQEKNMPGARKAGLA